MFKNWTWKEWTAFAFAMLVIIGEVVLVFVQPWSALFVAIASLFSFIAGWIASKHVIINSEKKE